MEWQPIETAPKDGTSIMVWADGYRWPEIVKYEKYDEEDAMEIGAEGYWTFSEDLLSAVANVEEDFLTHWMPIPEPPKE